MNLRCVKVSNATSSILISQVDLETPARHYLLEYDGCSKQCIIAVKYSFPRFPRPGIFVHFGEHEAASSLATANPQLNPSNVPNLDQVVVSEYSLYKLSALTGEGNVIKMVNTKTPIYGN